MSNGRNWATFNTDGDPILVVGRRPGPKTLEGFVVELHQDTFGAMNDIVANTLSELADAHPVDWHPDAEVEPGDQYALVNVTDLPAPVGHRDRRSETHSPGDPEILLGDAAALLRIVLAPGDLENLHPSHLAEGDFRFYAVVYEAGNAGRPVAFVSEYNPTTVLRKAKTFFRFDGTLRQADPPDFALNDRADLVVTTDQIAVLRSLAFDRLFSDVRAMLNNVPANVTALQAIHPRLRMSEISRKALEAVCATRPSYAKRLQVLVAQPAVRDLTPALLTRALRKHEEDPTDFIRAGVIEIDHEEVGPFLDVLEERWYEADFTSEPRRAGKWTRRTSPRRKRRGRVDDP